MDRPLALLGQRIRIYRCRQRQVHVDRAWTQEDLAVAIGSDKGHVNRIECGRQRPTLDTLSRICDALTLPWAERRRLLSLAGYLVAPPAPADSEIAHVTRAGRVIQNAGYPACLVDSEYRLWDVNELFASAFLDYLDRDACLTDVRGRRWIELICDEHRVGAWLRQALPDFPAFARRHLTILQRALTPGCSASPEDEALLNVVLADRLLCGLWLSLSAHLADDEGPDYLDHQVFDVRAGGGTTYRVSLWQSVLAADDRFTVVHLVPADEAACAYFASRSIVKGDKPPAFGGDGHVNATERVPQRFPRRPITLIVPWSAGGATDVGARILAPLVAQELGQAVVVVNRDASQSITVLSDMAAARADGYHLAFINEPAFETALIGAGSNSRIRRADFRLIANQAFDPIGAFVRADSRYGSLRELIRDAAVHPRTICVGTSGPGTPAHLGALMLERTARVEFCYLHFHGSMEHIARFLAGQTDVAFFGSGITLPALRAGEVRALAMFTRERFSLLPEVSTAGELGLNRLVLVSTRGVWAPAGVPERVFRTLEQAFLSALRNPTHLRQMHASGLGVRPMNAIEYEAFSREQRSGYDDLVGRFDIANDS